MDHRIQIGAWTASPGLNTLQRGDQIEQVEPKLMDLLVFMASHPSQTLARQRILDEVWTDMAVVDGALSRAVYALRSTLGDDARNPTYIQTVPQRGYRWVAPTEVLVLESQPPLERSVT